MAPDGLLRVVNPGMHRIEAYTPDGDLESFWGRRVDGIEGFCGCCNPANIAILPDGRIVTAEKGIPRVKVYHGRGQFVAWWPGPEMLAAPRRRPLDETAARPQAQGPRRGRRQPRPRAGARSARPAVRIFERKGAGEVGKGAQAEANTCPTSAKGTTRVTLMAERRETGNASRPARFVADALRVAGRLGLVGLAQLPGRPAGGGRRGWSGSSIPTSASPAATAPPTACWTTRP